MPDKSRGECLKCELELRVLVDSKGSGKLVRTRTALIWCQNDSMESRYDAAPKQIACDLFETSICQRNSRSWRTGNAKEDL